MTTFEWNYYLTVLKYLAENVTSWFSSLMFSTNAAFFFYLSAIAIFQLVRLLLAPILGGSMRGGSSDKVKSKKVKENT